MGAARQVATSLGAVGSVFANPDMRRLQLAWAGASFAMWSFAIALGVYAFGVGGVALVGVAGLIRLLPGAFASPFGGLLGDRHSRRAVLLLSAGSGSVVLGWAALAVALDAPAAAVFALAGLWTVASSPYVPAEGALLPAVARTPQELSASNVAHSAMDSAGFLAGSIVTGILLAITTPEIVFAAAALVSAVSAAQLVKLGRDKRPSYADQIEASGVLRETALGARALLGDTRLRLVGTCLTLLVFFEGAADVLVIIVALDLLGLGEGSVGYLNAAWGIGALLGGAALAVLLDRGRLAMGLLAGSLVAGAAIALPGIWAVPFAAYLAWVAIGVGYTFVEVVARTLLQRLGSDETLARALGFLETSRFGAMALGSIAAPALVALLGTEGALIAVGAVLPLFALLHSAALRSLEVGAPVEECRYALLRANSIFAPLPVDTIERLSSRPSARDRRSRRGGDQPGRPRESVLLDRARRGRGARGWRLSAPRSRWRVLRRDRPAARCGAHRDGASDPRDGVARARPRSFHRRRDRPPAKLRGRRALIDGRLSGPTRPPPRDEPAPRR